jgi:hypothetical protein
VDKLSVTIVLEFDVKLAFLHLFQSLSYAQIKNTKQKNTKAEEEKNHFFLFLVSKKNKIKSIQRSESINQGTGGIDLVDRREALGKHGLEGTEERDAHAIESCGRVLGDVTQQLKLGVAVEKLVCVLVPDTKDGRLADPKLEVLEDDPRNPLLLKGRRALHDVSENTLAHLPSGVALQGIGTCKLCESLIDFLNGQPAPRHV